MACGCGSVSTPNSTTPNLQGCRRVWELGIEELGEFAWLAAADRCQRPTPQLPTSKGAGEFGSWELRSWESSHGLRLRIGVNAQLHNSQPPRWRRVLEVGIEELGEFAWLAAADRCQRPTPQLPTSKGAGECGSWELRSWESSHGLRLRIGVNAQLHNSQPPRVPESLGVGN